MASRSLRAFELERIRLELSIAWLVASPSNANRCAIASLLKIILFMFSCYAIPSRLGVEGCCVHSFYEQVDRTSSELEL